jgi:hypothetical protein
MMGYSGIGKRCDTCARTPNAPRFSRHSARLLLVVCCTPASTYAALRPAWTTGHSTYQASVIYPKDVVPLRESRRWRRHENMIRGESRGNRSDSGKVLSENNLTIHFQDISSLLVNNISVAAWVCSTADSLSCTPLLAQARAQTHLTGRPTY